MQLSSTPQPLQALRVQLDQCRAIGARAVFPEELKQRTVELLGEYSSGAIIQALGISPNSLSRWRKQYQPYHPERSATKRTPGFISLPSIQPTNQDNKPLSVSIAVAGSHGDKQLCLQADVTHEQWQSLLSTISMVLVS